MKDNVPEKVKQVRDFIAEYSPEHKSISFSQLSLYLACPYMWYRAYALKEAPYVPTIHTVFGTAVHETVQTWLGIMYEESGAASDEFDYESFLLDKLREIYTREKTAYGKDFTTASELGSFYQSGLKILKFIVDNRRKYFDTNSTYLVGCEIPLYYKLRENFYFKGFIDILSYNAVEDRWKIFDIKTSSKGWNPETCKDFNKTSQVLLYKHFLSKQFNIPENSIDVEYFILKRNVYEQAQYESAKRRVQEFTPANKSVSVKKAVNLVENFMRGTLTDTGNYQNREYEGTPSAHSCKYCIFKSDCKHLKLPKNK